jgi:hypothetical protein
LFGFRRLEEGENALAGALRVARRQQPKFMSCVPCRYDDQKIALLALHNPKTAERDASSGLPSKPRP